MRKIISVFLSMAILASLLTACAGKTTAESSEEQGGTLSIVTTIFAEYDWVREILGDTEADLTLLIGNGVDLHSFQPTVDDILAISTCDLFIYVGGESDEWVEDALAEATNENMIVLSLLDLLGDSVLEEELVEGMEAEEEEEDEEEEEEAEYDEHVWLSLKNAQVICDAIAEALCELDSDHAEDYSANNSVYQAQLQALDEAYSKVCQEANQTTLLFGDRFPFRYLVEDYGLDYYAAFIGCSAETEASFETIVFLAQKVDELNLSYVLIIETSDGKIAETIVQNTEEKDQQVLTLNSMQAVTYEDITNGVTYLSLAEENLSVLQEALQ